MLLGANKGRRAKDRACVSPGKTFYSCAAAPVYLFCLWGKLALHAHLLAFCWPAVVGDQAMLVRASLEIRHFQSASHSSDYQKFLALARTMDSGPSRHFSGLLRGPSCFEVAPYVSHIMLPLIGCPHALPLNGHGAALHDLASISQLRPFQRHPQCCQEKQRSTCTYSRSDSTEDGWCLRWGGLAHSVTWLLAVHDNTFSKLHKFQGKLCQAILLGNEPPARHVRSPSKSRF
jgi:hypothetical protein